MSIGQIFFKKLGFPDTIFSIIFNYDQEWYFPCFIHHEILINFVGKKLFFTKDLLLFYIFDF